MRIHYDNMARSRILTEFIEKNDLYKNYHMIDMCTGSGSFLIWALKQGLFPNRAILVDNDINLLKSIKSNLRQNFKNIYVIKSNTNNDQTNLIIIDAMNEALSSGFSIEYQKMIRRYFNSMLTTKLIIDEKDDKSND